LKDRHPHIEFSLISANSKRIRQLLINDQADIGLTEGNIAPPELQQETLIKDEIVLVTNAQNRHIHQAEIDKERLRQIQIIIRESGFGTLDVIVSSRKNRSIKRSSL